MRTDLSNVSTTPDIDREPDLSPLLGGGSPGEALFGANTLLERLFGNDGGATGSSSFAPLSDDFDPFGNGSTPTAAVGPSDTASVGDGGTEIALDLVDGTVERDSTDRIAIAQIHDALTTLGYDVGSDAVTGEFGNDTQFAVTRFQEDHDVQQTGAVGPTTLAAMTAALAEPKPGYLSENYTIEQFTRSGTAERFGLDNTPNAQELSNLRYVAQEVVEPLTDYYRDKGLLGPDETLPINSGFRSQAVNDAVGGSPYSDHRVGEGVDIGAFNGVTYREMLHDIATDPALADVREAIGSGQVIDETADAHLHIGVNQDGGQPAFELELVSGGALTPYDPSVHDNR